jgi:hypothetical protein
MSWAIRYLVIDTSNWWIGKRVLIPREWVEAIDWINHHVEVDVTRAAVKAAPEYDRAEHVNRQSEVDYYTHHRRDPYWVSQDRARKITARQLRPPIITK